MLISASRRVLQRCGVLESAVLAKWTAPLCRTIAVTRWNTSKRDDINLSTLFKPIAVKAASADDSNIGAELTGTIDKTELVKLLNKFTQRKEIRTLCMENGLDCKEAGY